MRLAPGLTKLPPACPVVGGSMSSDERKDVLSRSVFVLVIVRKESRRLFSIALGVPFKSRIYRDIFQQVIHGVKNGSYLLEVGIGCISYQKCVIEDEALWRILSHIVKANLSRFFSGFNRTSGVTITLRRASSLVVVLFRDFVYLPGVSMVIHQLEGNKQTKLKSGLHQASFGGKL